MQEHLWGRILTFIRQRVLVTDLYLNLNNCYCPAGCCRLADQVMQWGWSHVWVFGLPLNLRISGATGNERKKMLEAISSQHPSFMPIDRLADVTRVAHPSTFNYRTMRDVLHEVEANGN
jgi:hypothetical protein